MAMDALNATGLAYAWQHIKSKLNKKADLVNGKVPASQLPSGGGGGDSLPPMTEITWSALKALRDGGQLTPGMQYRITDYNTIVTGYYDLALMGAQGYLHYGDSAGHPFDVIVTADDESTLNENARAALHAGDTYFANSDIATWQLKYCLDNDATRFSFANASGKGVIYWMKDEFDNECGYDFKNWKFVRYALKLADATADYTPVDGGLVYDAVEQPNRYGSMYHVFTALQAYMTAGAYVNPFIRYYNDTPIPADYDLTAGANILGSIQMASIDATYKTAFGADLYYTFDYYDATQGTHTDMSLGGVSRIVCKENDIPIEIDMAAAQLMQNMSVIGIGQNVFQMNSVFYDAEIQSFPQMTFLISGNKFGVHNYANTFGNSCYSNTFGNSCYSNTFANSCYSNTFGNSCYSNTFGNSCYSNTFGNYCYSNTFGNSCYSNTFGNSCDSNTFGNSCDSNTFGNYCYSNTFGNSCYSNTFGNSCYSNTFGNSCYSNTFGNKDQENGFVGNINRCRICDSFMNNTLEANGTIYFLVVEHEVSNVVITAAQLSNDRGYTIENWDLSSGRATLIHHEDNNTKTAVKTTDGGQTWTTA